MSTLQPDPLRTWLPPGGRAPVWSWPRLLGGPALALLGLLATRDAWRDIGRIAARDPEMGHLFLVPLVAAWLVWVRRGRLRRCQPEATGVGPVLVGVGWLLYSLGDLRLVEAGWHAGAVLVVVGCLLSVWGLEVLLRFLPAFAVLAFLVPVPGVVREQVALPLQALAARLTGAALELCGVEVFRTGNLLRTGGAEVAVAEACNGLRMVFALTLVAYAFAFGTPLRQYVRALIILASPLLALALNVGRLGAAVWLYGHAPRPLADLFHDTSGWLMLPVAFLVLFGVLRLLRWALLPVLQYNLAHD